MPPASSADHRINTESELRQLIGSPTELVCKKLAARLNPLTREFILRSPFVCVATTNAEGNCDVSPRGDPAGFVRILDDQTLLIPERPGNRIADTLTNIIASSRIGLLFLVPGVTETFRVNGRATLTTDPELLAPCAVEGKAPRLGIVVSIEQAFTQCSKAPLRAQLWEPSLHVNPESMPSNGQILRAIEGDGFDAEGYDAERSERYRRREGFY